MSPVGIRTRSKGEIHTPCSRKARISIPAAPGVSYWGSLISDPCLYTGISKSEAVILLNGGGAVHPDDRNPGDTHPCGGLLHLQDQWRRYTKGSIVPPYPLPGA